MFSSLLLVMIISNNFDKSSGKITVCKSFPDYNHDLIENKMECDKQLVFIENTENSQQYNYNLTSSNISSLKQDLNQMNKTIQVLSGIVNKNSNQIESLQQNLEQMEKFTEDMKECINFCVNGRCVNENNSHTCSCSSGYSGTNCSEKVFSNCNEVSRAGYTTSGIYNITVSERTNPVRVYCDQKADGGGWLVFQRRINGSVDFYRNWTEYEHGFGNLNGEFWLGLDLLYAITSSRSYQLRVDLEDWNGNTAYAVYRNFSVGNSQTNFTLSVSGYSGTAGNSLDWHNNQQFSTKDRDNDDESSGSCSQTHHGAWWYKTCYRSNLNGEYLRNGEVNHRGVVWLDWKKNYFSIKRAEMKMKPN